MKDEEKDNNLNEKENFDKEAYYKVVKPLRTYEGDVAETVRKKEASKVSVHLEEKERERKRVREKPDNFEENPSTGKRIVIWVLIFIILLTVGFLVFRFWFSTGSEETETEEIVEINTLIRPDISRVLDLTDKNREEILQMVVDAVESITTQEEGSKVVHFHFVEEDLEGKQTVDIEKFLSIIAAEAPPSLIRTLGDFNFGLLVEEKNSPFIIVKIKSFENAFNGMLSWEKTIAEDLNSFVSLNSQAAKERDFKDLVIRNKDLRVLRDPLGNFIILYSFLDKNTLLISRDDRVFREILDRYLVKQLSE